jgi:hypothetical protein
MRTMRNSVSVAMTRPLFSTYYAVALVLVLVSDICTAYSAQPSLIVVFGRPGSGVWIPAVHLCPTFVDRSLLT